MSRGMLHTVMRKTKTGWIAIRMYDDQEIHRETGKTRDEAFRKLAIQNVVLQAFKRR